ncbi:chromate transporter [Thomasclavelia sp.]|uniref:chromate transporter n=1 Tax=Thomasclavelia sp. TaxID=3025757 RepID=UPI0025DC9177|nr:chromate transporter [Thomasclavelia sp.]
MILIQLFLSFLQIGAFSFGGGYAALPLIQNQIIDLHQWMNLSEFSDLITISQMTPGPIAINSATFVGIKIAGIPGAIVATLGCILPSCILITILAYFYLKYKDMKLLQNILNYLRPAVVALIATAGLTIIISAFFGSEGVIAFKQLKIHMVIIFAFCLFLLIYKKANPILVMVLSGVLNVIYGYLLT